MTNQTSPFETGSSNANSSSTITSDEFSIRTMKDDLELMKKGEFILSEKDSQSTQSSLTKSIKDGTTKNNSNSIDYSKNPSPFISEQPAPEKELFSKKLPANAPYKLEDPFTETKKVETFSQKQSNQNESVPIPAILADTKTNSFKQKDIPIVEVPTVETSTSTTNGNAHKIIIAVVVVLIIAILALGGYYFWITKTQTNEVAEQIPVLEENTTKEIPTLEEAPVVIEQPSEKYSTSKPNYLVLDIAAAGENEIKNTLTSTALEIKGKAPPSIYEFSVVDKNNNPVTFAIFVAALKIDLSQNILSALDKDFSLFIYNDNGNTRVGLAVSTKNKDILAKELRLQENTFAIDLSPIFLDVKPEIQTGWTFKDGSYETYKTRYLNLNAIGSLSIDYTLTENKLVIGTSMETMRAIINSMQKSAKQISTAKSPSATPLAD